MILMKAKEFALLMNTDDFQVSAGWLFPFWEGHSISWKVVCGEEMTADAAKEWHEKKWKMFWGNIFLKTYKMQTKPHYFIKCYQTRGEKCAGGKESSERLTAVAVLLAHISCYLLL
jgi:hypothetical protein